MGDLRHVGDCYLHDGSHYYVTVTGDLFFGLFDAIRSYAERLLCFETSFTLSTLPGLWSCSFFSSISYQDICTFDASGHRMGNSMKFVNNTN